MRIPIPSDREKKAWAMALLSTSGVRHRRCSAAAGYGGSDEASKPGA